MRSQSCNHMQQCASLAFLVTVTTHVRSPAQNSNPHPIRKLDKEFQTWKDSAQISSLEPWPICFILLLVLSANQILNLAARPTLWERRIIFYYIKIIIFPRWTLVHWIDWIVLVRSHTAPWIWRIWGHILFSQSTRTYVDLPDLAWA